MKSGAGKPPAIPSAFETKAKAVAIDDPRAVDTLALRMLHAHADRRSTGVEVVQDTIAKARRAPNRTNLERMRFVANELGRQRGGGKLLRQALTQELADEIIDGKG